MKIDKVYYEELKSVFIDGKWANKKVGIGATIDNSIESIPFAMFKLKELVKRELRTEEKERGLKYKEVVEQNIKHLKSEMEHIENDCPF